MDLKEIEDLTLNLMIKHGLNDWSFRWDNAVRRLGCCRYRKKEITLSKNVIPIQTDDEIKNTILHEIAHALVDVCNNHNKVWRAKAIEIGCNGNRCASIDSVRLARKFIGTCPVCFSAHKTNRRKYSSCGKCSKKFDKKYLFVWSKNIENSN